MIKTPQNKSTIINHNKPNKKSTITCNNKRDIYRLPLVAAVRSNAFDIPLAPLITAHWFIDGYCMVMHMVFDGFCHHLDGCSMISVSFSCLHCGPLADPSWQSSDSQWLWYLSTSMNLIWRADHKLTRNDALMAFNGIYSSLSFRYYNSYPFISSYILIYHFIYVFSHHLQHCVLKPQDSGLSCWNSIITVEIIWN